MYCLNEVLSRCRKEEKRQIYIIVSRAFSLEEFDFQSGLQGLFLVVSKHCIKY